MVIGEYGVLVTRGRENRNACDVLLESKWRSGNRD